MAEQPPWLNIRCKDEVPAQYFQKNTDQDSSQQSSLPHNNQHSQTAPTPWTPCSDTPHTHTELVSREHRCPHLLATSRTHPCLVAPIKEQNRTILCSGSNAFNLSQNKNFRFFTSSWLHLAKEEIISQPPSSKSDFFQKRGTRPDSSRRYLHRELSGREVSSQN